MRPSERILMNLFSWTEEMDYCIQESIEPDPACDSDHSSHSERTYPESTNAETKMWFENVKMLRNLIPGYCDELKVTRGSWQNAVVLKGKVKIKDQSLIPSHSPCISVDHRTTPVAVGIGPRTPGREDWQSMINEWNSYHVLLRNSRNGSNVERDSNDNWTFCNLELCILKKRLIIQTFRYSF